MERISEIECLPSPSSLLLEILILLGDPDVDLSLLELQVMQDPALAMLCLRKANSAAYSGMAEVGGIREAMSRIGLSGLRQVIIACHGTELIEDAGRGYGLSSDDARRGALAGALAAEQLASSIGADPTFAFTAGLLRDCGKLVMDELVGVQELERDMQSDSKDSQLEFERRHYGFDHAECGGLLARIWSLPEKVAYAIEHHHTPSGGQEQQALVDCVYGGDVVCGHLGLGVGLDGLAYPLDHQAMQRLGLDRHQLAHLIAATVDALSVIECSI